MLMRKFALILLIIFVSIMSIKSIALAGCSDGPVTDDEGNSSIIKSITPDPSKPLTVGQIVDLEIEVAYKVVKSNAVITLLIQKGEMLGNYSDLLIASKVSVLNNNEGTVKIKQSFRVPETGAITIHVPLMMGGAGSTKASDGRAYKVLGEDGTEVEINEVAESGQDSVDILGGVGGGFMEIASYIPEKTATLSVGETVDLKYHINYEIDSVPAVLNLTVQKGEITTDLTELVITTQQKVLKENKGSIVLEDTIVVPDTSSILVAIAILKETMPPQTIDMETMYYNVEKK